MVDGFKTGTAHASLHASYEFYFGKRNPMKGKSMPHYECKHVPDTPLTRVYRNGEYRQEFTSLAAAKAYVEHLNGHDEDYVCPPRDRDEWKHEAAQAMRLKR